MDRAALVKQSGLGREHEGAKPHKIRLTSIFIIAILQVYIFTFHDYNHVPVEWLLAVARSHRRSETDGAVTSGGEIRILFALNREVASRIFSLNGNTGVVSNENICYEVRGNRA